MVYKLVQGTYPQVRGLFRGLMDFQPMCAAVLEGVWPGEVYADNLEEPQAALLVTFLASGGAGWCFLAGNPNLPVFNQGLNQIIFQNQDLDKDTSMVLFTCDPVDWDGQLEAVGKPRQPVPMARRHYVGTSLSYDWRGKLPEGFEIQPMDTGMLERKGLSIPEAVRETLVSWQLNTHPDWRDYGLVAVHQEQIVAWATVDFVATGAGDLGFETLPAYRRRGLGSILAAAAIEHGLKSGLKTIHWTCMEDNIASIRTAEKLGLVPERDYPMYVFALDVNNHRAHQAYALLADGELEEACRIYEGLFAEGAAIPLWAYCDAAKARAALGDAGLAMTHLQRAAELGWTSLEWLEQTEEFRALQDTPEWVELLARVRANQANSQ